MSGQWKVTGDDNDAFWAVVIPDLDDPIDIYTGGNSKEIARLIAAAPDLAAALERFVTFHSGHVLSPELVSAMTAARAALSRAKGETP